MTKAIEVEVDGGSANPVRFTLDDARIRSAGHKVQIALHDDAGDPEERTRLWRGALQIARNAIEKSRDGKNEIYGERPRRLDHPGRLRPVPHRAPAP